MDFNANFQFLSILHILSQTINNNFLKQQYMARRNFYLISRYLHVCVENLFQKAS